MSERCGDCLLSRARLPQASLGCKGAVTSFAPSADGRLIASASTDGSVRVSTLIVKSLSEILLIRAVTVPSERIAKTPPVTSAMFCE